jgi:phenylacetic acid degradation protein
MPFYAIEDLIPVVHPSSYVHPSAEIIGDVIIEDNCYIGPNACLRGDFGRIHVKSNSNVQDNCVLHSFPKKDCILEPFSHIGHGSVLHGCHIGENVLIGMKAVVMDDAKIGKDSIVAACAFVKSKFECEPQKMIIGSPAKVYRDLSDDEVSWKKAGTHEYVNLARRCQDTIRDVTPLTEVQVNRPRFENSKHQIKSDS